jgi:AmiR/NasT family two-component response regulator
VDAQRHRRLRVLVADEGEDRLAAIASIVTSLGHEVVAHVTEVAAVAEATHHEQPDVALVGVDRDREFALELIEHIAKEALCPAIVIIHGAESAFLREAAKRGVFAHIAVDDPQAWQDTIEIVLERFEEYHSLRGAFGRRAQIEQAKGILMERHDLDADAAFAMLRDEARRTQRSVVDIATALVTSHRLLPGANHDEGTTARSKRSASTRDAPE